MVDARQQGCAAADVVPLLTRLEAASHVDVVDGGEVDAGVALLQGLQRNGGQVVGADVLERSLNGTADGGADGVDDDGFGHGVGLLDRGVPLRWRPRNGIRRRPEVRSRHPVGAKRVWRFVGHERGTGVIRITL